MANFRHATISASQRQPVYKDVICRLHAAIAVMQANQLLGLHDGWTSMQAMRQNLGVLEDCLQAVLDGEPIETTQRSQLFAMRELALANSANMLLDGCYVMPGKNIVLSVGPLTFNFRRQKSGVDVIVLDSPHENQSSKTHHPFPVAAGGHTSQRKTHEVV